jgi:hypothetical protein
MAARTLGFKLRVRSKASQADTWKLFGAHQTWAEQRITGAPDHIHQSTKQERCEKEAG